MAHILDLPAELLLMIFHQVNDIDGQAFDLVHRQVRQLHRTCFNLKNCHLTCKAWHVQIEQGFERTNELARHRLHMSILGKFKILHQQYCHD